MGAKILLFQRKDRLTRLADYSHELYISGNVRTSEKYEKARFPSYLTRSRESLVCRLELYLKSRDLQRCYKSKCRNDLSTRLYGYFRPPYLNLLTSGPPLCRRHKVCTNLTPFLPMSSRFARRRFATPRMLCLLLLQLFDKLLLFDSLVLPILLYGAEVWAVYKFKDLVKLHIKFLMSLFGVKMQTPNYANLGEFERYPISVICEQRALKFWRKIMSNSNQSLYETYAMERNNNNANNWSNKICSLIDYLALTYIRLFYDINVNYPKYV